MVKKKEERNRGIKRTRVGIGKPSRSGKRDTGRSHKKKSEGGCGAGTCLELQGKGGVKKRYDLGASSKGPLERPK